MRINILDPGLEYLGGHHLETDAAVASALINQGHQVHIFANRDASDEVAARIPSGVGFSRIFRCKPYEAGPAPRLPIARYFIRYRRMADMTAEDLAAVAAADAWLWPSLFAEDLRAAALVATGVPMSGVVHMGLHYFATRLESTFAWRDAARAAVARGVQVSRVGTLEGKLADNLRPMLGRFNLAPMPVPLEASGPVRRRTSLRVVGFFGHQRPDKGVDRLNELTAACVAMGVDVLVHDSSNWDNELRDIPGVRRVAYVDDLPALIGEADLIMLPYGLERYRSECSGIACLGIACGVPILAPEGTTMADRARKYDTGLVYTDSSTDGICRAIAAVRDNYSGYAARAYSGAAAWAETEGVARHTAALMVGLQTAGN